MNVITRYRCDLEGLHDLEKAPSSGEEDATPLCWLDVPHDTPAGELCEVLSELGVELPLANAEALLVGADRPRPDLPDGDGPTGTRRLWAFAATVEKGMQPGGRHGLLAISLQPVSLLVSSRFVLTCRHPGRRFPVGDVDEPITQAPPLDFERLHTVNANGLIALLSEALRQGDEPSLDRDLLLFGILHGLVETLFDARSALGTCKIVYDDDYFAALIGLRKRAATAEASSSQVAFVARQASLMTDEARRSLASIQRVVVEFRRWFDDLKPPGLSNRRAIWLPQTTQPAASERLVDRIYQVRNDLQSVRRDTHQSMSLLASADTGGQLLAVRALLDRTESARIALIVASAVTVLLASVALSASIAAIPRGGVRFHPFQRALGYTGVTVLGIVIVGVLVALLSRQPPPPRAPQWKLAVGVCFLAAVVLLILAAADGHTAPWILPVGVALGVLALLTAAYVGDFGPEPKHPALAVAVAAVLDHGRSWQGSFAELAQELPARVGRTPWNLLSARGYASRLQRWRHDPLALELDLHDEQHLLEQLGMRVRFEGRGSVTIELTQGETQLERTEQRR